MKEIFTDKLELENDIVIERAHRDKKKKVRQATLQYRKEPWKEVKRLREEDKIAYLQYRSVVAKEKATYVNLPSFSCLNKV